MNLTKRILTWLITSYVLTIMVLSVAAINSNKQVNLSSTWVLHVRLDYLLHALQFIPWMILICWRWREKKGAGFFMLAFGAGLALASISEGVQYLLPYRSFNVFDLVSNCVGLAVGALIVGWGGAKRQARQKTL